MPAGDEPTGAHIDFLIEKSPVTSLPIQRGRISSWVSCLSSISAIVTPCADGHDRLPKMAAPPRRRYRNAAFDPGGDCGADVSRGPFIFWKTTPYKVVFGCASCAPRQGEIGFAFPIVQLPRRSHTRAEGHRHFRAIHALVGIRSTFAVRI
jgi:hypothetical protein